jgi:hypothetical protein
MVVSTTSGHVEMLWICCGLAVQLVAQQIQRVKFERKTTNEVIAIARVSCCGGDNEIDEKTNCDPNDHQEHT